jgi:anti-anti-sigma factor
MVKFEQNAGTQTLLCTFTDRLDTVHCAELAPQVDAQVNSLLAGAQPEMNAAKAPKVVFDLAGVDFVASSFFRICIALAKRLRKGNLSIRNTNPLVKKTFTMAGLDDAMQIG